MKYPETCLVCGKSIAAFPETPKMFCSIGCEWDAGPVREEVVAADSPAQTLWERAEPIRTKLKGRIRNLKEPTPPPKYDDVSWEGVAWLNSFENPEDPTE